MTGKSYSRAYKAWANMRQRCAATSGDWFKNYAARGIGVCPSWAASFDAFYDDMGDPPTAQHTLDRIDNDHGYEPGNCRWATRVEQTANRRGAHRYGNAKSIDLLAAEGGLPPATVRKRLSLGWSLDRALAQPLQRQNHNRR